MTDTQIIALIAGGSGVVGALLGALGGVVGNLFSAAAQRRQERTRLAVQLGLADYAARIDAVKSGLVAPGQRVVPVQLFVDYSFRVIAALEKGPLTPESIKRLHEEHTQVKAQLDAMPAYYIPRPPAERG